MEKIDKKLMELKPEKNPGEHIPKFYARLRLWQFMVEDGLNISQLAERYPCDRPYIRQLLKGGRGINKQSVGRLAKALNRPKEAFYVPEVGSPEFDELWMRFLKVTIEEDPERFDQLSPILEVFIAHDLGKLRKEAVIALVEQAKLILKLSE